MRRAASLIVIMAACAVLPAASAQAAAPVLGKSGLFPTGRGWGTAHPRTIFNGGSPGGLAEQIRWTRWGRATARGQGLVAAYRPQGGYYAQRVPIQFRASRLGRCPGSTKRAYTRLISRSHDRPGGSYGDWSPWTLDLCDAGATPRRCGLVAFTPNSDDGAFSITAWDTSCTTAQAVATASRDRPVRQRPPAFTARGFRCSGFYSGESLPSVLWRCTRNTAVVSFTRS